MIRSVRAAGFAVAAFALSFAAWGGPLQAGSSNEAPATAHYLDHDAASADISLLGLNGEEGAQVGAAATVEPAATTVEPAAAADASPAPAASLASFADHLVALADAALPRPRSLGELAEAYSGVETANREQDCLASAVYFEARGESLEGQLAVAEVVLNRTQSGRYPATVCGVVTQPWQFSFVNATRRIPAANRNSEAWRRAVAIARIAEEGASRLLPRNVLWYHADYVSPVWGRRLARNTKIGLHIFYS
jgi:spore germination cell wall hydrolase CwlJ-like protein